MVLHELGIQGAIERIHAQDVLILQQIFGHSAPPVTLWYIEINDDMVDQALE